jgi:hypothetical protein
LGGDSQETGWRRWVAVMTANGTDSRLLTQALDGVHDLIWYPKLGVLGLSNWSSDPSKDGLFTLSVHGQGGASVSLDKIERPVPDNFRTNLF